MENMEAVKRPSLSEQAISRLIDPRTGEPLMPLGVVGGRVVWPMMGAAPDPDDDDEKDDAEDEDERPEGSDSDEDEKADEGDPKAKIAALEDEKERHFRHRKEAEKENSSLKARLAELEGKDKTEVEKLSTRVDELTSENGTLKDQLQDARLSNAFLSDNTYNWHNPGRALQVVDLSEVEIDSDGKVNGLKSALDKLAKSDPYLIKKEEKKDDDEGTKVGTGTPKNQSRKSKDKQDANDATLRTKYSALQR